MTMNRRNVLIGLGTIVAGGGAALGTGAFSSVGAERTVSIETADDADALLGLHIRDDFEGTSDGVIDLDLAAGDADGLNVEAETVLAATLLVQNNGEQEVTVSVSEKEITNAGELDDEEIDLTMENTDLDYEEVNDLFSEENIGSSDYSGDAEINEGEYTAFDLTIDLRNAGEEPGNGFDATITIDANGD